MKTTPKQTQLEDIFVQLRAAEAEEVQLPADAYNLTVNALAKDPTALDLEEVRHVCKDAGKSAADLERHVRLVKPFADGMATRAEEEIESAQTEIAEIGAAREAARTLLNGKLPTEADKRASEALSRRLNREQGRIKAARAKLAEMQRNQALVVAELRGQPVPVEIASAPAKIEVEVTPASTGTKRPAKYDKYDQRWEKKYDPTGVISYYFQGRKVA